MPNVGLADTLRNSVTIAALLLVPPGVSTNSAGVPPAPPKYVNGVTPSSWAALPPNFDESLWRQTAPPAKKAGLAAAPLTPLGLRLLALRRAAIEAGMQTLPGDVLMEEFRTARDA